MLKIEELGYLDKMGDVNGNQNTLYPEKKFSIFEKELDENVKTKNGLPKLDSVTSESDVEALAHQIAGHSRTGILKHKLGYVLKPRQKEPLGSREVNFYKRVFDNSKDSSGEALLKHQLLLQKLIPKFHGMTKIQTKDGDQPVWEEYLAVDDIIEGFTYPCVTDIKIGAQTWDPYATPKKIEHEKSKYKGTKGPLGLSLTGMQYFDLNSHSLCKMEKELGKTIDERGLVDTLEKFLNRAFDKQIPGIIAKKMVERLKDFQEYFEVQRDLRFYSSSLLIAYDAKKFASFVEKQSTTLNGILVQDEEDLSSWLRIWMIDFAHVVPAEGDKPDSNYIFGLNNLVNICQEIGSKHMK